MQTSYNIILFFQLWVTGGQSSFSKSSKKSIEIVDENGSQSSGHQLLWDFHKHCSVVLNQTHAMLTGGYDHPNGTLIINLNNSEATRGPYFQVNERDAHACARLSHHNGTNFIVVAGGSDKAANIIKSSEVLDIDDIDQGWFQGKIINKI